jgi:hypothetical protein
MILDSSSSKDGFCEQIAARMDFVHLCRKRCTGRKAKAAAEGVVMWSRRSSGGKRSSAQRTCSRRFLRAHSFLVCLRCWLKSRQLHDAMTQRSYKDSRDEKGLTVFCYLSTSGSKDPCFKVRQVA